MERVGRATHLRQGYGSPSIEGKVTRAGASECGQQTSFNRSRVAGDSVLATTESGERDSPGRRVNFGHDYRELKNRN